MRFSQKVSGLLAPWRQKSGNNCLQKEQDLQRWKCSVINRVINLWHVNLNSWHINLNLWHCYDHLLLLYQASNRCHQRALLCSDQPLSACSWACTVWKVWPESESSSAHRRSRCFITLCLGLWAWRENTSVGRYCPCQEEELTNELSRPTEFEI